MKDAVFSNKKATDLRFCHRVSCNGSVGLSSPVPTTVEENVLPLRATVVALSR